MTYPVNQNNRRHRNKYRNCDYVIVYGGSVRLLTETEKEEFRSRIQRIREPSSRARPHSP